MISTYTVAPFRPLPTERLVRQLWTRPSGAGVAPTGFAPAADVYREGDDLVARFDLPGVDPERDVTVELEGRRLVVRGERRDQRVVEAPADEASDDAEQAEGEQPAAGTDEAAETTLAGRRVREVRFGEFRRTVTLPKTAEADAVRASYDAGVLTVTVPAAGVPRLPLPREGPAAAGGRTAGAPPAAAPARRPGRARPCAVGRRGRHPRGAGPVRPPDGDLSPCPVADGSRVFG